MKRAILVFCSLVVVFAALLSHQLGHFQAGTDVSSDTEDSEYEYYDDKDIDQGETDMYSSELKKDKKVEMIDVDTKPDSITVLVNRKYRMDKDYVPADLVVPNIQFSYYGVYEKSYVRQVAASALERLFTEAQEQGVVLKGVSGYRSYARQQEIYNRNVNTRGKTTTNLVSAQPGASEHQTGLTMDVSSPSVGCTLETNFGDTTEGKWLAKHCHKFGFIIRYPEDKTEITGYSYEPWHIRYVGKKLASYLYKKKITLEEYYQTTTKEDKITEPQQEIHDVIDDNEKGEPQMITAPTPKATVKPTVKPTVAPYVTRKPSAPEKKTTSKPKPTKKPKATKRPEAEKEPEETDDSISVEQTTAPQEQSPEDSDTELDTTYEDVSAQ